MDPVLFSPEIEPPRRNKRTIDIGVATVVAAGITALGGITTVVLLAVLNHPAAPSAQLRPTVTITATPQAVATVTVTARPAAAPTATQTRYITVGLAGGAGNAWVAVAAAGTAIAGLGTIGLGFSAVVALRRRRQPEPETDDAAT